MEKLIVVFGGAFSPVTNAHLAFATHICNEYDVEKFLFLPVGDKYQKSDLFPASHRVNMLKDVCASNPKFGVSEVETRSEELMYTIDSLKAIQDEYPKNTIAFAMGTDNLKTIHTWKGFEELVSRFKFLIVERSAHNYESVFQANPLLQVHRDSFVKVKDGIRNDISSTKVRELLSREKSVRYLVPDSVCEYMSNNSLNSLRNWATETDMLVRWIKGVLEEAHAKGVILGLSGGLDSAVVAALALKATDNVLGVMMPCGRYNDGSVDDAKLVARALKLRAIESNITGSFYEEADVVRKGLKAVGKENDKDLVDLAFSNIKPRIRMATLYAIGQALGYLVAGTGNKSEIAMGYFTKWGDGASDFNPLAGYTKTEVFEWAEYLGIPEAIISKPPSANLWEGQTDEEEMGITYKDLDTYLIHGTGSKENIEKIEKTFAATSHKRSMPKTVK